MNTRGWLVGAAGLLLGACATGSGYPRPSDAQYTAVLNDVRHAESQAAGGPDAVRLRGSARQQYEASLAALQAKDYERANLLLARADADAALSIALARRDRSVANQRAAAQTLQTERAR